MNRAVTSRFSLVILLSVFLSPVMLEEVIVITQENQSQAIQSKIAEFRTLVHGRIYPNNSYIHHHIRDDLFVFHWLQSSDFLINQAVENFTKHLAWRYAEKIDTIDLEDWSSFREDYPKFYTNTDKIGRPVAEVWLSVWDIRRAIVSGQGPKLMRWMTHTTEMAQRKLYKSRSLGTATVNTTGAVQLIDAEGFNLMQHGCPSCLPYFLAITRTTEGQYPYFYEDVIIVNVSGFFRQILATLSRHFDSRSTARRRIYSGNRREWMAVLDSEIDRNQRSTRFGGIIVRTN